MQLALIGSNDETLRFARSIAVSDGHNVQQILHADHHRNELFDLAPAATWPEHWEELLLAGEIDAVVATPHDDLPLFEEQLRKLTQGGVPLIIIHPIHDSLFAYELEMMRVEAASAIVASCDDATHPAWRRLTSLIEAGDSSPIGTAEQLLFERFPAERNRANVQMLLSRDVTILRQVVGSITSINAVGGSTEETLFSNLCVNLVGDSETTVRWSVSPREGDLAAKITLLGSQGKAELTVSELGGDRAWSWKIGGKEPREETFEHHDEATVVMKLLEQSMGGDASDSEWERICRDLEVVEQTERSLRRKRTVELRRESQTEEGTFKGLMSASSCLLLMLVLLGFGVFAVVEGFRMPPIDYEALRDQTEAGPRAHLLLRLWPVYPLAAFLLFQFLLVVAKRPKQNSDDEAT